MEKLQCKLSWQCKLDSFRVPRQSLCGKFQIICGFFHPANPTFRMYGWYHVVTMYLKGKSSHFCPPALLFPTSFRRHSVILFPSRTIQNDSRTRNGARMTGTKNGMTGDHGSFGLPSSPFGPRFLNNAGRSDCVPVVPSKEAFFRSVSF